MPSTCITVIFLKNCPFLIWKDENKLAITCKSQIYNMVKFYKHIVKMLNMNKEEKKAF